MKAAGGPETSCAVPALTARPRAPRLTGGAFERHDDAMDLEVQRRLLLEAARSLASAQVQQLTTLRDAMDGLFGQTKDGSQ